MTKQTFVSNIRGIAHNLKAAKEAGTINSFRDYEYKTLQSAADYAERETVNPDVIEAIKKYVKETVAERTTKATFHERAIRTLAEWVDAY